MATGPFLQVLKIYGEQPAMAAIAATKATQLLLLHPTQLLNQVNTASAAANLFHLVTGWGQQKTP